MFNLNEEQRRVFRVAAVFAFAFWLCNQIADSTLAERVWHQLGILAVGIGAVRGCALEGAKHTRASSGQAADPHSVGSRSVPVASAGTFRDGITARQRLLFRLVRFARLST
jgi:hypothetical protein